MSSGADKCLFCRIIKGEIPGTIVHQDEDVVAFEDVNPKAPTHILVVPRRHIASIDSLTPSDEATIGKVIHRAAEIARQQRLSNDGYRLVFNQGDAAGQTVYHIHLHLLGGRTFTWPPG